MSRGHRAGHHSPVEETLAMEAIAEVAALVALLQNFVQQVAAAGAVVAAGSAITPDANLTLVASPNGSALRVKITATTTFTSGAGTVRPVLQTGTNGGPLATLVSGASTSDGSGGFATSIILTPTPAPVGTVVNVHWQTTVGDAAATLGGTGGEGAVLLVQQIP